MSSELQSLETLLDRHDFDCAVIADREGAALRRIGRFDDDVCIAALNRDFFDPATVKALGFSLEDKVLPQTSSRGECWALSGFTPDGSIIAMYGRAPGDVCTQYWKSREIWRELETSWPGARQLPNSSTPWRPECG